MFVASFLRGWKLVLKKREFLLSKCLGFDVWWEMKISDSRNCIYLREKICSKNWELKIICFRIHRAFHFGRISFARSWTFYRQVVCCNCDEQGHGQIANKSNRWNSFKLMNFILQTILFYYFLKFFYYFIVGLFEFVWYCCSSKSHYSLGFRWNIIKVW